MHSSITRSKVNQCPGSTKSNNMVKEATILGFAWWTSDHQWKASIFAYLEVYLKTDFILRLWNRKEHHLVARKHAHIQVTMVFDVLNNLTTFLPQTFFGILVVLWLNQREETYWAFSMNENRSQPLWEGQKLRTCIYKTCVWSFLLTGSFHIIQK